MKTLSNLDTVFVSMDSDRYPMHGGGLMVLDPSTSPEPFTLDRLRQHILRLLPVMPPLRRRLVEVPFGIAAPAWVEDPDFDIDRHLHHIAVPAPGGEHEVATLMGELGSMPLDMSRPLWDFWFIEGLAEDKVALFLKMHHASIDGMGGVEMLFQMFTMDPNQVPEVPQTDWKSEPVPSQLSMLIRSAPSAVLHPLRSAKAIASLGVGIARGRLASTDTEIDSEERVGGARLFSGPRLPFNEIPNGTPHKASSFANLSMADVKQIREIHGCTVNDVALAVSAAAIRRWLIDHNALPDSAITCGNPVNTRAADEKGAFENKFTLFTLQLPTHLADPVERLTAINAATKSAKAAAKGARTNITDNIFQVLSPGVTELVVGGLTAGLGKHAPVPFNTLVTNVQGPPIPLYLAGAELKSMHIQMMQIAGLSLVIAVMSYAGKMFVCITGHRENTPDVWTFSEEMTKEVSRLLAAKPAQS